MLYTLIVEEASELKRVSNLMCSYDTRWNALDRSTINVAPHWHEHSYQNIMIMMWYIWIGIAEQKKQQLSAVYFSK